MKFNDLFIFDIDGTIADNRHRLHYILREPKDKDWDSYDAEWANDTPLVGMIDLVRCLQNYGANVMFLTGRNVRTRSDTLKWLYSHGVGHLHPELLVMRGLKDYRDAGTMKVEYLAKRGIFPEHVHTIFDDNNHVVRALRDAGYHVCHVADDYTTAVHEGGPGQFDEENDDE
jgi:predicted secreted acid phosphatase